MAVLIVLNRIDIQRIVELRGIAHSTIVCKQRVQGVVDAFGGLAEQTALVILQAIEELLRGLGFVEGP